METKIDKIVRKKKRRGRGIGSGGAKSGRGMKGQKSRAGYSSKAGFEGGQTPLYMRLPKGRGTKTKSPSQKIKPSVVTTGQLNYFSDGDIVGPGALNKAELVQGKKVAIKLIGNTPISKKKLTLRVHAVSAGAKEAVEAAGGKVELIK